MLAAFLSQDRVRAVFREGQLGTYLAVLAAGSSARVFGLASQFIVLIILNRILSKDSFGDMMIAFGFYRVIGMAFGIGASLVLIYHVSRHPNDRTAEIRLHRYSAFFSATAAALVALAGFALAGPIAHALAKPGLEAWFRELAPFGIFTVLLVTSTGALEGRSRITESIFLGEAAPNAVRMVLLPAVALSGLPNAYVAHAMTLSVFLPWLWSARSLCDRSVGGWRPWTFWDLSYCGKFVAATLFANQLGAVDILVAGMLFPSEVVADYAVAARIAALYSFFQIVLLKRFAPRAAQIIQTKDLAALRQEYVFCRKLMVGCSALNIAGILCIGPFLLPLFGNYTSAGSFLVWLAIHSFMHSFFATSDRLLLIAGQANVSLRTTASTFGALVTAPFVIAPLLGPTAIPITMALACALLYPLAARVKTLFDVRTFEPRDLLVIGAGITVLVSYAITGAVMWGIASVTGLSAIALYYCLSAIRRT
ncbi:lipopolysaccharide biosynthesis protein [Bradyrhizobium sp. JYMT SZCCT0428]|uniref:lipopolysaccharide biosynthesis protein n=1 Tax=Bradyrhizobium sp. JYMT SZCCT0428 TaxID=2807673 RepID=UPI001BAB3274|nr:oligosaccharide flippase family protein [Bradyrhizobium sp. JYMT SZCCT0428]MBR1155805.1 oligosaccharide flippase family protein [Bradyrhizobium sp. JYMT SZCCT0428]